MKKTATVVYSGGEQWYECRDEFGDVVEIVATLNSVLYPTVHDDEPTFIIRDGSGRGVATKATYLQFDATDREYANDDDDTTFGEWLDECEIGDEYKNDERRFTVIRTN